MYQLGCTLLKMALKPTQTGLENKQDYISHVTFKGQRQGRLQVTFDPEGHSVIRTLRLLLGMLLCSCSPSPPTLSFLVFWHHLESGFPQDGRWLQQFLVSRPHITLFKQGEYALVPFIVRKGLGVFLVSPHDWLRLDHLLTPGGVEGVRIPRIPQSQM